MVARTVQANVLSQSQYRHQMVVLCTHKVLRAKGVGVDVSTHACHYVLYGSAVQGTGVRVIAGV